MHEALHKMRVRMGDHDALLNSSETEWKLPKLLYAVDSVLFIESEKFGRMLGCFDNVCWRNILKDRASKNATCF